MTAKIARALILPMIVLLPSIASAKGLKQTATGWIYEGETYLFEVADDGRWLSLKVEGVELIAPQPEGYLPGGRMAKAGKGVLSGSSGSRTLAYEFSPTAVRMRMKDSDQTTTERFLFPLSRSIDRAVFPARGGQTYEVPVNRHLNSNQGARFLSGEGPVLETGNRTFLQEGTLNMGIFIYPQGHELIVKPLLKPAASDVLRIDFSGFPKHHLFPTGDLRIPVTLRNLGKSSVRGTVRAILREYNPNGSGADLEIVSEEFAIGGDGEDSFEFALTEPANPGPYRLAIEATGADGSTKSVDTAILHDFPGWRLPDYEPDDFEAFWQKSLRELRSVPLNPRISEPTDRRSVPEPFREVSFNGLDGRRIRGFLGIPPNLEPGERVPAIVTCPGAGYGTGPLDRKYLDRGWVTLVLSVHDLPFGGESGRHHPPDTWSETSYQAEGLDSPENYFFRAAYLVPVRGYDFLASLPMVESNRILVSGGSQGGSMTLAALALEPRFAMGIAGIPGRIRYDLLNTGYRANGTFDPPPGMTSEEMVRGTLAYFDIAHFASRIRNPVWVSMSLNDPINPGPLQLYGFREIPDETPKGFTLGLWTGHGEADVSDDAREKMIREALAD